MLRGRDDLLASLEAGLRRGGAFVLMGAPGSGRTAVLSALATADPDARLVAGLRTAAGVPLLVCSWAVGRDLGGQSPTEVAVVLEHEPPGPLLVDDADDTDPATMEVLVALAGRRPLLVGARSVPRGDPAPALVARLAAAGAVVVALEPLAPDVAERLAGDLGAGDSRAVARRSGGVPGLLVPLAGGSEPPDHRLAAVDAQVDRLSRPARDDLAVAGLVSRAVALHDLPSGGELEEAQFLTREDKEWVVRHGLAAERLLAGLEASDRQATYRRAAGLALDPVRVVELLQAAGDAAEAVAAARSAAADEPDPGRRARLWALVAAGTGDCEAELEAATAAVRAADGPAARHHAAAAAAGTAGISALAAFRSVQATRLLGDEASALTGLRSLPAAADSEPSVDEVRIETARLTLSTEWRPPEPPEGEALSSPGSLLVAGLAAALAGSPDASDALAEAVAAADAALDRDIELAARAAHVAVLASRGDGERTRVALAEIDRRVAETGARSWLDVPTRLAAAMTFHLTGDPRPLLDLGAAGDPLGPPLTAHLAVALADVGRTGEAAALVEAATWPDIPVAQGLRWWAAAEAAFSAGRLRTAVAAAERCADSAPPSFPAVAGAVLLQARAAVESGDAPRPLADGPLLLGAQAEHEALRLMDAGDGPGAAALFDDAAARWAEGHRRAELRCRWSAADVRLRSAGGSHRDAAVEQLRRLDGVATELGLRPLVARVRRSLRTAGVRLAAEVTQGGRGPLSPREREVLRLVGEGRSSSEIAAHLGVAPSTVETQIKSAIRKLGATNRRHAAALAAEAERS